MCTVTFFMCLFGFPETKWHRLHSGEPSSLALKELGPSNHSSKEKVAVELVESTEPEQSNPLNGTSDLFCAVTTARDPYLGKGVPSKQQWKLFQANAHPFRSIFLDLWIPWKLFAFPIVEFASFVVSWSASSYLTLNLTQSEAFGAAPYNYSSETIGFFNFASLIGALIGLFTAGPLSDWVSMRATRKNGGIREPEMRLPSMIPYVILMIIGNFVVAFGFENHWDWKVCPYFLSFGFPLVTVRPCCSATAYVVFPGHCHNRLYMRRYPDCCPARNCIYLCRRFLQTRVGLHICQHHRQQKRLGLRVLQVHYAMDHKGWIYSADHDEYEPHHSLVPIWCFVLV